MPRSRKRSSRSRTRASTSAGIRHLLVDLQRPRLDHRGGRRDRQRQWLLPPHGDTGNDRQRCIPHNALPAHALALTAADAEWAAERFAHRHRRERMAEPNLVELAAIAEAAIAADAAQALVAGVVAGPPRKRAQQRPLLSQPLGDHRVGRAVDARQRHRLHPVHRPRIEPGQVQRAGPHLGHHPRPEVVAHVADAALDLALRACPIRLTEARAKAVVEGEVEETAGEDRRPIRAPPQDRCLEVVVEDLLRDAERGKRVEVGVEEVFEVFADREAELAGPRVAEREDEAGELLPAVQLRVVDGAELAPVHLRLVAGCRFEAHRRLRLTAPFGAEGLQEGAQLAVLTGVAAGDELVEQDAGVVAALRQPLLQVGVKGSQFGLPRWGWLACGRGLLRVQHLAIGFWVAPGTPGDLGEAQALTRPGPDLNPLLHAEHSFPPGRSLPGAYVGEGIFISAFSGSFTSALTLNRLVQVRNGTCTSGTVLQGYSFDNVGNRLSLTTSAGTT